MPARLRIAVAPLLAAFVLGGVVAGQTPVVSELNAIPNLSSLTRSAGYIFSGTVVSVGHAALTEGNAVATVRITFRVDEAIRGVKAGQTLTIREWAGLWDAGERYRAGQRVMLFLYPPSRLGLTSAVGGPQGRFALDRNGNIVLPPVQTNLHRPIAVSPTRPPNPVTINSRTAMQMMRKVEP